MPADDPKRTWPTGYANDSSARGEERRRDGEAERLGDLPLITNGNVVGCTVATQVGSTQEQALPPRTGPAPAAVARWWLGSVLFRYKSNFIAVALSGRARQGARKIALSFMTLAVSGGIISPLGFACIK
jgi:hypothetical protein